jgi:hypothetical protein
MCFVVTLRGVGDDMATSKLATESAPPPAAPSLIVRPVVRSAQANGATATAKPTPVVKIDNTSDAFATVVSVEYGEKLGELLETVRGVTH